MQRDDLCYRCRQSGHWANACPLRRGGGGGFSPETTVDGEFPAIPCQCGGGLCLIKISASCKNPGRKYYCCPSKNEKHCRFFQWCNELKTIPESPAHRFPMCTCGAGICALITEKSGHFAGRKKFVCPIKKGQGSCNFVRWQDDAHNSTLMVNEVEQTHEEAVQLDAVEEIICEPPIEELENQLERNGGDATSVEPNEQSTARLGNLTEGVQAATTTTVIGLPGDPASAVIPNSNNRAQQTLQGNSPLLHDDPSPRLLRRSFEESPIMTGIILQSFEPLALHLQGELVSVLLSMGPQDHKTMSQEADCTFTALDCLQADYIHFAERVREYIKRAAALQEIDESFSEEKSRFEEFAIAASLASDALAASNEQIFSLRQRTNALKDMLAEFEAQLCCCERKEVEIDAAKAAFENARAQLLL